MTQKDLTKKEAKTTETAVSKASSSGAKKQREVKKEVKKVVHPSEKKISEDPATRQVSEKVSDYLKKQEGITSEREEEKTKDSYFCQVNEIGGLNTRMKCLEVLDC